MTMNSHILQGPTTKAPAKRVMLQDSGLTVYRTDLNESLTAILGHVRIVYCDRHCIPVQYDDGLGIENGIRRPLVGDPVDEELSRRSHSPRLALEARTIGKPHDEDWRELTVSKPNSMVSGLSMWRLSLQTRASRLGEK